jgi:hypothetical protein
MPVALDHLMNQAIYIRAPPGERQIYEVVGVLQQPLTKFSNKLPDRKIWPRRAGRMVQRHRIGVRVSLEHCHKGFLSPSYNLHNLHNLHKT